MAALHLDESEINEKASAHSSDDAKESTASVPFDESYVPSASVADERLRLERKIEKIRKKITKHSLEREDAIEHYLTIMNSETETAQMARLKQNFERKNKKYSQEAEQLQKKLDECEKRLQDLENGVDPLKLTHSHRGLIHNVGHGISRTAGTVINTPIDIVKSMKKNVFGSADNLSNALEEDKNTSVTGKSTFYDDTAYSSSPKKEEESHQQKAEHSQDTNEIKTDNYLDSTTRLNQHWAEDAEHSKKLLQELLAIKQQNNNLQRSFETLKRENENEVRGLRSEIIDGRFKMQQLEQNHNESIELYQNEIKQLKNDLNLIGTRMDYQYNVRFKKIEESVEGAQNRLYRMETNWHENAEKLLGSGQSMGNAVMLSFANIVVEILKIILYFISVVMETFRGLTGTRKRVVISSGVVIFFVLWSLFGFGQLFGSLIDWSNETESKQGSS